MRGSLRAIVTLRTLVGRHQVVEENELQSKQGVVRLGGGAYATDVLLILWFSSTRSNLAVRIRP